MAFITESEYLQQPTLQSFVTNRESEKVRRLSKVYPDEQVFDINNAFNMIEDTGIKAGSIIGFDAETPIRTKPQLQQKLVSLSKIAHAHHYTEEELYKYFNPRSQAEQDTIITDAITSIATLDEGVEDMKEYIRAQMTYNGRLQIEDPKSQTKIGFEFDLPEETFMKANDFASADVNPIEVLEQMVERYQENNNQSAPAYMVMNRKTYNKIRRNKNVVAQLYGNSSDGRLVRNEDMETMFADFGLPTLEIDDNVTIIEGVTGDIRYKHLEDDKVVMHAEQLGNTLIGPAADNNFAIGKYVVNVQDKDPISEKTIVGEVTIPVLKNAKGVVILEAKGEQADTEDDAGEQLP